MMPGFLKEQSALLKDQSKEFLRAQLASSRPLLPPNWQETAPRLAIRSKGRLPHLAKTVSPTKAIG